MPFDNRGEDGLPSISPSTSRGVMPFNNVPTIQDLMRGNIKIQDYNPHSQGDWAPGEDVDKSYREKGDDYKRRERDVEILSALLGNQFITPQKWMVKVPGGTKTFMSFELARKYTREKNIPFSHVQRVAQNKKDSLSSEQSRIDVIANSINKTLMVQSINVSRGVIGTGSAFCVAPTYFITCAHVLNHYNKNENIGEDYFFQSKISLIQRGQKTEAFVIKVDPKLDIALLKCNIDAEPFKIDLEILTGMDIIVIGSPHSYENNVSIGTVGSMERKIYFYKGAPEYMFVDLSVFSGNSGGPVIKVDSGKVIGMVTLIVAEDGGYGLNAALPSHYILKFCSQNIKGFNR